jgi:hypothetical protein
LRETKGMHMVKTQYRRTGFSRRTPATIVRFSIIAGSILAVSPAFGVLTFHHGVTCHPETPADAQRIVQENFGTHNTSATARASVACAVSTNSTDHFTYFEVVVYDRHPTQDVCCSFKGQNTDGTIIWSGVQCSSGVSSSSMPVGFSSPTASAAVALIECEIPPVTSTGISHLASYTSVSID